MNGWNLSHASSYSCPFLIRVVKDARVWHSTIRAAVDLPSYCKSLGQGRPLGHSVFTDDTWVALYRVVDYAMSSYRRGWGISNRDGVVESTRVDLCFLALMSVQLLRKNDPYVFLHASRISVGILKSILFCSAYLQRMRRSQRSISHNRLTLIAIARTQCTRICRTTLPQLKCCSLTPGLSIVSKW